jgi:hypothetical protein
MPFPIVTVRSLHHEPDELFPVIAAPSADLPVVMRSDDGETLGVRAREITVRTQNDGHVRELVTVRRRGIDVLVTDSRVVVSAEHASPHGVLAGHVKYPWLVAVGGSSGNGRFDDDELRLVVQRSGGDFAVLTIGFEPDADVHGLAQEIAQRAARLWLEMHPGVKGEFAERWESVADAARGKAPAGEFALHWMPEHVRVDSLTRPLVRFDGPDLSA